MSDDTRSDRDLAQFDDRTERAEFADLAWSLLKAADLLAALLETPRHKRDLADSLGVSKSTVYNWTSELEAYNLLERTGDGYRLTYVGRRMAERFFEWRERATGLFRLTPFADALPRAFDPPPAALESATVVVAESDPDAPADALVDEFGSADGVSALVPVVSGRVVDAAAARADDDGDLELVVPAGSRDRMVAALAPVDGTVPEEAGSGQADDGSVRPGVAVRASEDLPSFGLARFEGATDAVGLTVYSPRGHVVGFVRMTATTALTWAEDVYETYRERAESAGGKTGTAWEDGVPREDVESGGREEVTEDGTRVAESTPEASE